MFLVDMGSNHAGEASLDELNASAEHQTHPVHQFSSPLQERMRRKLKFHFMNPWQKWRAKRKFPCKMILQFVKIVFVTIQVSVSFIIVGNLFEASDLSSKGFFYFFRQVFRDLSRVLDFWQQRHLLFLSQRLTQVFHPNCLGSSRLPNPTDFFPTPSTTPKSSPRQKC